MNLRDALGLAGSLLLLVGLFIPMVRVPVMGRMSYFHVAPEAGVVLVVLVAVSLLLVQVRRYRLLLVTGLGSLGVMAYGLSGSGSGDEGSGMRYVSELVSRSVRLEWGLGVMVVGGLLVVLAGIVGLRRR